MNYKKSILLCVFSLLLAGCTSYKKSIYLRNDDILQATSQQGQLYEYRIMPKDELTIVVSTSDPASSVPFYRKIGQSKNQTTMMSQGMGDVRLFNYLVDNDGYIDYPVLGKLHLVGLSTRECEALFRKELSAYLNEEPNVTVRISNFKVSVLGEVNKPGTYPVTDERINIFQALAQAGDMTLFSDRDDVQLLRMDAAGKQQIIQLNLTDANISTSPYYYLQQNDVVYVKPLKGKVRSNTFSTNSSIWISLFGLLGTIASLIIVSVK